MTLGKHCGSKNAKLRLLESITSNVTMCMCTDIGVMSGSGPGQWGANLEEFHRRFSEENTNGEGPEWLRNLYFVYLLEMRALAKAAPYLEQEEYFTGRQDDDNDTKDAVVNLLQVIQ